MARRHDGAPVEIVGHVPGEQGEHDGRQECHEPDEPEGRRALGQVVDVPAHRDVVHLKRQAREEAGHAEEPEVDELEGGPALA